MNALKIYPPAMQWRLKVLRHMPIKAVRQSWLNISGNKGQEAWDLHQALHKWGLTLTGHFINWVCCSAPET